MGPLFWFFVILYSAAYLGWLLWDIDQWNGATGPLHWVWATIWTICKVVAIILTLGLILAIMSGNRNESNGSHHH